MAKKILVIEDDALVIRSVERYLESQGYNVEAVQSGREAIEKAKKLDFDLIISDIRMPEMDGIEVLRRIREASPQYNKEKIPIIIITAYAGGDEVYKKASEIGIVECIYKPFEPDEFMEVVRRNLELPPKYREISLDYKLLDNEFVSLTNELEEFLKDVKDRFDEFDRVNKDEKRQIEFIRMNKKEIFTKLDDYFAKIWQIVKDFERNKYIVHQNYYQQRLCPLIEKKIEINKHIFRKTLGYAGDYITMNYIYDYNGDENYLGKSSYEKLINNYTCNIPISCSNIKRKEFLKEKILETLGEENKAKILSVGCGPVRELIELIKEGKITKPLLFTGLDFERKVLDYISNEIDKIEEKNKHFLSLEYICRDITSIVRDKALKEKLKGQNLIYASGIFDYLSDRMASRLTQELYQLLDKGGKLIICNVSLENSTHRAYYELLGEWNMMHRTRRQMLKWVVDIEDVREIRFEEPQGHNNYLFLSIEKI
ncbi:MAG: response regulator [Candidatus Omnitrophica bacterium]|nr:response regulator [Candidatus Omnitrophota bacterium]